jgi:hypothetical protein
MHQREMMWHNFSQYGSKEQGIFSLSDNPLLVDKGRAAYNTLFNFIVMLFDDSRHQARSENFKPWISNPRYACTI